MEIRSAAFTDLMIEDQMEGLIPQTNTIIGRDKEARDYALDFYREGLNLLSKVLYEKWDVRYVSEKNNLLTTNAT